MFNIKKIVSVVLRIAATTKKSTTLICKKLNQNFKEHTDLIFIISKF